MKNKCRTFSDSPRLSSCFKEISSGPRHRCTGWPFVQRVRRNGGWDHALCNRQFRSYHHRRVSLRDRLSNPASTCILAAKALAARKRLARVTGLGLLFFGIFPIIFNAAFIYTTAARGSLALSTLPLLTMAVGALLGIERLGIRKTAGVLIATGGVALALAAGFSTAPEGAWRGDLLMVLAALCMAFYNVWSRPFIARSAPLSFAAASMGIGSFCLALLAWWRGGFDAVEAFGTAQWIAVAYLGLFGGAVAFFLWVFALERASPTRVASTITINPIAASLVAAALLGEEIGLNLVIGVAAVLAGIWVAASEPTKP
jgi:drug/metabolite transporter (DMT)-like permease